jgi:ketosteroid isomerase-like protein
MTGQELEALTRQLFIHLDAGDFDAIKDMVSEQGQGVDELSRRWMRGRADIDAYFRMISDAVSDVRSTVRDVSVVERGDVGIVTCLLDQSYTYEGRAVANLAPTTIVFFREAGDWKIALVHSVPLPEPS